jgi:trimethylamine--corrinoid protein Co-methyltransferase
MTLVGSLALGNAEFLALGVMQQMIQPETPLIYAVLSTVADMRTGAYVPGAIETGIMQMAHSQMAHYYNVPSGGYIGLTNAHVNDAQSGYETGMNTTAALLAGADLFNMGGLLGSLMTFDFAKAVIDDEIAMMLKQLIRGVEYSEEDLALNLISEIGPGGNYMDCTHTIEHMRSSSFFPDVANRDMRETWTAAGRKDAAARALHRAQEILTKDNPAIFSLDTDEQIRSRFKGLVSGDAGWQD